MLQYLSNLSIYNNLRQDTHSLVRSQANYEWFKLHHSQSIRSLSKSERKQLKKFLESQKPISSSECPILILTAQFRSQETPIFKTVAHLSRTTKDENPSSPSCTTKHLTVVLEISPSTLLIP